MRTHTQQGLAPVAALIIALLVIGGGAYGVKKVADKKREKREAPAIETGMPVPGTETKEAEVMEKVTTLQIKLNEQNTSGVSGQAVITQIGTSTIKVIVNLTGLPAATGAAQAGKPSTVPQPAHIHLGSCPAPGAVKYPLKAVEKGAAQTELLMTLEQLLSELPLAINVHKSAADIKTYVACGNIAAEKKAEAMSPPSAPEVVKKESKVTYNIQGFSPKTITIKKGETVVFENKTGKPASVASAMHPTHLLYPEFDQYKTDQRGNNEFRFTFEKVGTWNYHDHLNSTMTGTVIVE